MSIAGKLAVIASFIFSTSVQPGKPKPNTSIIVAVYIRRIVAQGGNSSAALKDCLTLETEMIGMVNQIMTGSRP